MDGCHTPRLSGFNIELLSPNFTLNVQDINGNLVDDADITIECDDEEPITGKTDSQGCFSATMLPGEICTLTISKDCYQPFVQRFLLVPIDVDKNFVFKVVDEADEEIEGATVTITSPMPSSIVGMTGADGMFAGDIKTAFTNTLTIQKSGFQNKVQVFSPFSPVTCFSEEYRIAPVITLETVPVP